jgi:phosphoenolpyruvate carboxylase
MIEFINTSAYPLYEFIDDLKNALEICKSENSNLQKFRPKIKKMLNGAKIVGYHLMQGQSRLDAESLTSAAKNILKLISDSELDTCPSNIGARMIWFMLNNQSDIFGREHELNYEDLRIFRHFKLQSHVNKFNNRHIPKLVIANFTNHLDFLSGLFLLHQTENLTMDGSEIIHSKVKMIPLLESTENFYMFPGIIQKLLTVDLVRNYIEWYKEMVFMIACSDTPRENGPVAANSAIMTCLRDINDTFLKGIHLGEKLNQERLLLGQKNIDYGLVSSNDSNVEEFWNRIYSNNKIVHEDENNIQISYTLDNNEKK